LKRPFDALSSYERATKFSSADVNAYRGLGDIYADLGRREEALSAYEKAREFDAKDAGSLLGMGNLHRDAGEWREAEKAYKQAARLQPNEPTAYANLGDVYNANGQSDKALDAYKKAVELDPEDALSRGSLAGLYRRIGQTTEYARHIGIARELIAQESEYNRACLEAIVGNKSEALDLLKTALEKHQVQMEWVRRDPDLDSLRLDPAFVRLVGG
jgi:Flp pilus assembly protein TadD